MRFMSAQGGQPTASTKRLAAKCFQTATLRCLEIALPSRGGFGYSAKDYQGFYGRDSYLAKIGMPRNCGLLTSAIQMGKSGWQKYNGKYYYLDSYGRAVAKDWVNYNGKYYYMNADGNPITNCWITYNGKKYHFNASGICDKVA